MAETAEQHGIRVVLATLLPIGEYNPDQPWSGQILGHDEIVTNHDEITTGHDKIQTLNNWLRNFANQKRYALVDYYSALADDRGYYQKGLSSDGVHPSSARKFRKASGTIPSSRYAITLVAPCRLLKRVLSGPRIRGTWANTGSSATR